MLYDLIVQFLGAPPLGLEFLYYIFSFVLLLLGFIIVILIFNAFFKLFKRGR